MTTFPLARAVTMNLPTTPSNRHAFRRLASISVLILGGIAILGIGYAAYTRGLQLGNLWGGRRHLRQADAEQQVYPLRGRVQSQDRDLGTRPLANALILAMPLNRQPQIRPRASDILTAVDGVTEDRGVLDEFRSIGADLTRSNDRGEFELKLLGFSGVMLLVVGEEGQMSEPNRRDLATVGHFVVPAYDLLAGHFYQLVEIQEPPLEPITIQFEGPK